jgi:hypothetical protein
VNPNSKSKRLNAKKSIRRFAPPIPAKGHQGFFFGRYDSEKDVLIDVEQTEEARALRVPDCLF